MRNPLQGLGSVGAKVTWIVAIVSAAAVLAVTLTSGVRGYLYLKEQSRETAMSQSLIVAESSSAALSFRDREMAAGALAALKVVKGLQQASLIDAQGVVFARYVPSSGLPASSGVLYPVGHWRNGSGYALVVPVTDRAGAHGRLQVNYVDSHLKAEALALALQAALLSLAGMLLALVLVRKLHPVLTAPIVELENTTRHVRDTGDYGARAQRVSNDELGRLTADFNEMLERIESSQRELLQAQQRAEEASRLKDEFVATLSHELRTPLSPIVAWIHMLRMPQGAAQLGNGLNVMERNANALIRIIDDLLDMSRIVAGTLRLDVQPVDINGIVRAAAETLAPAANSRQIHVDIQLASPPPPLNGDPSRLQQVVWNLLSNAIKFSPPGARVTVTGTREGARLDLVFQDAGVGVEPTFLPFVFDRFRQQDGSITRSHGGLGLGLSIVRQLVELHGGTVSAHSPGRDQGATFVVSLPVARHPAATVPVAAPVAIPAPPRLDGVTLVLVEDEADMRAVVRAALQDAGATVHESADAREALALLANCTPDALVSDIGLPDMDGYALLQQLRATPHGRTVPALALTAYARPEEQQRAFEAGYRAHLSKPVDPAELVEAVAAAVEFSRRGGAGAV
jgi:signal transduction histidine kinase/ActR/RegA family two-component response regulator